MTSNQISLDPDQALATVTKLMDGQDVTTTVAAQVEGHGTNSGPVYKFKWTLDYYVSDIRQGMDELRRQLDELQTAITKTVVEIGEQDEALAAQSAQFAAAIPLTEDQKLAAQSAQFAGGITIPSSPLSAAAAKTKA